MKICERKGFAGHFPQGICLECGHLIMAHIGCESCVVCRLESLIEVLGGAPGAAEPRSGTWAQDVTGTPTVVRANSFIEIRDPSA